MVRALPALAPKLIQASKQLLDDPTVADAAGIGVCNAEQNPLLLRRYRIGGFPTVLFLADGQDPKPYWGAREVHDIAEFVRAERARRAASTRRRSASSTAPDQPVRLLFDGHVDQARSPRARRWRTTASSGTSSASATWTASTS